MMTGVVQRFGQLDVLYNNAGSSHGGIPHMLATGRGFAHQRPWCLPISASLKRKNRAALLYRMSRF